MQFCNDIVPFRIVWHIESDIGHLIFLKSEDLSCKIDRHKDHIVGDQFCLFGKRLTDMHFFKTALRCLERECLLVVVCIQIFPDTFTHEHIGSGQKGFKIKAPDKFLKYSAVLFIEKIDAYDQKRFFTRCEIVSAVYTPGDPRHTVDLHDLPHPFIRCIYRPSRLYSAHAEIRLSVQRIQQCLLQ